MGNKKTDTLTLNAKADKVTTERILLLHPAVQDEVKAIYAEILEALSGKAICRFSHTLRTVDEQNALYAIGRNGDKRPIVTNAKGGSSFHNYGLAVDIVLLKDTDGNGTFDTASWETNVDFDGDGKADWAEVVAIFKQYGWEWGGDWKFSDAPHFQKTYGYTVRDLFKLHEQKFTLPGTDYIRINGMS